MSADASSDAARDVVLRFYEAAFDDRDPARAARDFMGATYTQHNPDAADGREGFLAALGGLHAQFPELSVERKRVIAEGDLVALHVHVKLTPEDRGMAAIDIFRVADGKVVEHWDVVQPVPEAPANDNTMF